MYEREKTIDVLRRLKAQENKPTPEIYVKTAKKEEPVKIVNLPQRKIEDLMHKVEEIRKKMKTGNTGSSGYFNLYYDLKNAEQNFVKEGLILKGKNFQIPETTMKRVDEMLNSIKTNEVKK